ncbi:MAG: hypothetical protein K2H84_08360 [Paramuribaculum sp.]|nr:hypothetical protein [Paramuribaculum sp.]
MGITISDRSRATLYRLVICITVTTLFMSCAKHGTDCSLLKIRQAISDTPEKALASNDCINPNQLSTTFVHFYDFLKIKAHDKAYSCRVNNTGLFLSRIAPESQPLPHLKESLELTDATDSTLNLPLDYPLHQSERERLAKERERLIIWLAIAGCVILALTIVTILRQRVLLKKQAKLQSAFITISELNNKLKGFEDNDYISGIDTTEGIPERVNSEISKLRETISRFGTPHNYAPDTEAYRAICEVLERGGMLKENDPLWDTISKSVNEMSPDFEQTLKRISLNKISMRDYRLVQLIKLGLSSSQIARLIGRSKSVIPYRRKQLCINSFNNLIQPEELNALIRNI